MYWGCSLGGGGGGVGFVVSTTVYNWIVMIQLLYCKIRDNNQNLKKIRWHLFSASVIMKATNYCRVGIYLVQKFKPQ